MHEIISHFVKVSSRVHETIKATKEDMKKEKEIVI